MRLIIENRCIKEPIDSILKVVRAETGYLKDIFVKSNQVICTCPFHKDGREKKPACFVYSDVDKDFEYGTFHCFACGESGSLAKLIGKCYGKSFEFGKKWLVERYGNTYIEEIDYLPPLIKEEKGFLPESTLDNFEYNNKDALEYLINKRKLDKNIIDKFKIGFDKETNSVTFPCRDEHGNLVGIFKRNIYSKIFSIPKITPKPIYLLDNAIKNNYSEVYVCESQINALTLEGWGFPAIALVGTGSYDQYKVLSKSGIRKYILAFDGDLAGEIGTNKFKLNVSNAIFEKVNIPPGKDVNDLTKEEFLGLSKKII